MGKRQNESNARAYARVADAQVRAYVQQSLPDTVIEAPPEKPPVRNMQTCGNETCCRYLAHPQLMDGRAYVFNQNIPLDQLPMACGGDLWKPKPISPYEMSRKRRVEPPNGLTQFSKPKSDGR